MKYTCPKCKQGFDKAIDKHCPHCKVALVSKRGMVEGKLTFWWELARQSDYLVDTKTMIKEAFGEKVYLEPEHASEVINQSVDITITPESPEKLSSKFPVRLTEPGQLPVVIQAGDNEFDVYFQHMMYTGMVYCPKCQSPAFQNMQLFGDLEHWCAEKLEGKTCKARTTYHFNDPNEVDPN